MDLNDQCPWTAIDEFSLLGIYKHFALSALHLVDTGTVVGTRTEVRSAIISIAQVVEHNWFACSPFDSLCVQDRRHHPIQRIVLANSSCKLVLVFTQIPGERFEVRVSQQSRNVCE